MKRVWMTIGLSSASLDKPRRLLADREFWDAPYSW